MLCLQVGVCCWYLGFGVALCICVGITVLDSFISLLFSCGLWIC